MGLETAVLLGTAALGAGSAAYSANQQKKGQQRAAAAAERQAKLSQTQEGANVNADAFRRRRRGGQDTGFDAAQGAMLTPGTGGGGLLGS
jgi:uncharacterized protein HemX